MITLYRLCLLTMLLLFTGISHANWRLQVDDIPQISQPATELQQKVTALPEPLFMSQNDHTQVRRLLSQVLRLQDQDIDSFQQSLAQFRQQLNDETWQQVESHYLTLNSLSHSKQTLLALADDSVREQLTGFGPTGVIQFKQELKLTQYNIEYFIFYQIRSFKLLFDELLISPIPVVWVGIKVFVIYLLLMWWLANSGRMLKRLKQNVSQSTTRPPFWVHLILLFGKAQKSIAWLIAITLSLRVLSQIEALVHLRYLETLTWWILGGSIAISLTLELVHRYSLSTGEELVKLRLSTLRRYVWSAIAAGLVLQIAAETVGKGTIYYWIVSFFWFWFILITLSVILMWKKRVFHTLERIPEKPLLVVWAVDKQNRWLIGLIATIIGATWLSFYQLKNRLISLLSRYGIFNQVLAYLFKIEVEKQTSSESDNQLVRVKGSDTFNYVLPGDDNSPLVNFGESEMTKLAKYLLTDSPTICVVSGERGIGATRLLVQMLDRVKNAEPIYINCPIAGYDELLIDLALSLGLEQDTSEIKILNHLRKSDTSYLIAIDNCQRLVKPKVGGLADLIKFTNLLRRSKKNHRAVFSIEKASWRFVDRARGERLLFDLVCFLPRWNEAELTQLLDSRINQDDQFPIHFDGLVVPKQWDNDSESEEERAKQGFYRILWHYADGNPTVALRFFRYSLKRDKQTDKVYVRLFHTPDSEELEKMPKPMLAIIRSIVQLGSASPEELSDSTQLTISEVIGTLRYFESRGYIEWTEDKARVSDHWFRSITNVLDRQHLLVK
ncbi:AAA family ATPase [Vibrio hippocampi]|uniref:ORC1/DEAH AAA+ ATPase domain-containing protein n=1 Tax=Vibrio hippocampi TaxID=654686 RepID=A0ABN8DGQ4_9VIBR|nr:AAA family ATPase [Vibrio hippocampi]CAH0525957.1 hypothetical protein VHP8226_01439 [Vibrio hippocampi]